MADINDERLRMMEDEMNRFEEEIGLPPLDPPPPPPPAHDAPKLVIGANTYNQVQQKLKAIETSPAQNFGPLQPPPAPFFIPSQLQRPNTNPLPPPPPPPMGMMPPNNMMGPPGMGGPPGHMNMGGPPPPLHMGGPPGPMNMGGPPGHMNMGGPPGPMNMNMGCPPGPMGMMGGPPGPMNMVGPPPGMMGQGGPMMGQGGPMMGQGGPMMGQGGPMMGQGGPMMGPPGMGGPPGSMMDEPGRPEKPKRKKQNVVLSATPKLYITKEELKKENTLPAPSGPELPPPVETAPTNTKTSKKKAKEMAEAVAASVVTQTVVQSGANVPSQGNASQGQNPNKKSKDKNKLKKVRTAGGVAWEDPTLAEWEDDDFRLFCGDLGNDVTDELLIRTFSKYPSFLKAKVVRDKRTNKTKGFGFVSFKDPQDFIRANKEMNGRYVGSRPIKLRKSNWKSRSLDVVRKKEKEKATLIGLLTGA
uniref:RNA-binding protein 42 n=1 Tax=Cacopsylla melanoneura TaxID=428564 RepID=A0A8D8LFB2_9HEMI